MSVGLVIERDHAIGAGLSGEELLERTIAMTPFVRDRMQNAERASQIYARKDFSYRVSQLVGENFALTGDATTNSAQGDRRRSRAVVFDRAVELGDGLGGANEEIGRNPPRLLPSRWRQH